MNSMRIGTLCLAALMGGCFSTQEPLDKDDEYEAALQEAAEHAAPSGNLTLKHDKAFAEGTFSLDGTSVHIETTVRRSSVETEITLRGMTLLSTIDRETYVFDLDGFASDSGRETQMTESDRKVLRALENRLALNADLAATQGSGSALDFLNRAVTLWAEYSTTMPLQRIFYGRQDQSASLCSNVNRKGAWGIWTAATHDCNSTAGDCSDWWGCDRWNDNSTTDFVFMSMHPAGSCADTTYFGNSSTGFSCFEPNHPGNTEYAYGDCFGRCGGGCGGGTVFTRDCVDHDQCVRLGHDLASFWCDDEFTGAAWDMTWGSNCSGVTFTVNYNWAGTGYEGACPTSWNNANDGCDVGCQFIDADCSR